MLGRLEHLPGPQRDALGTAFGIAAGPPPDRFLVGLAVLSLLSEVAGEQPLICIVDDAQWLDRASAQALAFAARRLKAESVFMMFAMRELGNDFNRLPELVVEGLSNADARELLDSAADTIRGNRADPRPGTARTWHSRQANLISPAQHVPLRLVHKCVPSNVAVLLTMQNHA
jgi:hypothetical protein